MDKFPAYEEQPFDGSKPQLPIQPRQPTIVTNRNQHPSEPQSVPGRSSGTNRPVPAPRSTAPRSRSQQF